MDFSKELRLKVLDKGANPGKSDASENAEMKQTNKMDFKEEKAESAVSVTSLRTTEKNIDDSSLILMISQVDPDPDQPRENIEEIEIKKVSIRKYGQLDPITVRHHPTKENSYMIVNGGRRWIALNELRVEDPVKFSTIRATLRDDEKIHNEADRLTIQIVSNLHRSNMRPLEAYKSLKKLKELKGYTKQSELVAHVGMSKSQISKLLRFDDLTDDDMKKVESGEISESIIRSFGIEEAKKKAVEKGYISSIPTKEKTGKSHIAMISISMESATNLAIILQKLATNNNLVSIELGNQTNKELATILEARSSEVVDCL